MTARSSFSLIAAALLVACAADSDHRELGPQSRTLTVDDGFETNDLAGWDVVGNVVVADATFGTPPAAGERHALLETQGGVPLADLADFLGVDPAALTALDAVTDGSAARRLIDVENGDYLQFDWNFLTNETSFDTNPLTFNDFTFLVAGEPFVVADTGAVFDGSGTPFNSETGYHTFTHRFENQGVVELGLSVVNVTDTAFDSAVLLDNVRVLGKTILDFETDGDGLDLPRGAFVDEQYAESEGVHIVCHNNHNGRPNQCITFDSAIPQGHAQLGTPNRTFGGPGIGWGGEVGEPGANSEALGNLLVIARNRRDTDHNGLVDVPLDSYKGGKIRFDFDNPTTVHSIRLVDVDAGDPEMEGVHIIVTNPDGETTFDASQLGNNSVENISIEVTHVSSVAVYFAGTGALADIVYRPSCLPGIDC